jgi:hypothetical protein
LWRCSERDAAVGAEHLRRLSVGHLVGLEREGYQNARSVPGSILLTRKLRKKKPK